MQTITPFLWFDHQAEDAAKFYASVFKHSKVNRVARYADKDAEKLAGKAEGSVMTVAFELEGQPFTALNGGPVFSFTEAISFVVTCETQEEVDYYWEKLSADGGKTGQCGWLKDQFGVSWQVVPARLEELMSDGDIDTVKRVTGAMLQMTKLDIEALEAVAAA